MSFTDQIADIEFRLGNQVLEGTGFLVGPNHLITNTHVMFDDFGRSNFSLGFEMTVRFEDGEVARPLPAAPFRFFNNSDFFDGMV